MIHLHKLNGQEIVVNAELVETIEEHGTETVIRLNNSNRFVVKESVNDVIQKAIEYRQAVNAANKEAKSCHSPSLP